METIKIDLKDKKILYELDFNARQSASQIAKKVGLSKDTVNYRINRLKDLGIIKRAYAVLNTLQIGFMHFNTLFRFRNINSTLREKFIIFCKKHDRIIWCVSIYGSWDFSVSFLGKDLKEYSKFIQEVLNEFGTNTQEKALSVMIDSPTYTRKYLIEGKQSKEFEYKLAKPIKLDTIDYRILSSISQNADMSIVDIAKNLHITIDIAHYRMKQLINTGIIQGFRIALDLDKIGYLYYKLLFSLQDTTPEREEALKEYCLKNQNIIQFIKYIGNWEIQIELEVKSESELFAIIEDLRNKFGDIIKTYEILRLKEEKLDYYPLKIV